MLERQCPFPPSLPCGRIPVSLCMFPSKRKQKTRKRGREGQIQGQEYKRGDRGDVNFIARSCPDRTSTRLVAELYESNSKTLMYDLCFLFFSFFFSCVSGINEYIRGRVAIDMSEASSSEKASTYWKELRNEEGKRAGEVQLSLLWVEQDEKVIPPYFPSFTFIFFTNSHCSRRIG